MTAFNFYLFDRSGTCLFFREWKRTSKHQSPINGHEKLMYGMLYSIKAIVSRISPVPPKIGFQSFKTEGFKLHYFETASGLKFILNTDLSTPDAHEHLRSIYSNIFVEYVIKNAAYNIGEPIEIEMFQEKLDAFVKALPFF